MAKIKFIIFFFLLSAFIITPSHAADTITSNQIVRYNETIVSPLETFELGFFNPANSNNHYVGIWYKKISTKTVVWVANRNTPLTHTSGELSLTLHGVLLLRDATYDTIVWSSANSSSKSSNSSARNPICKLLDTGNFIIYEKGDNMNQEDPIWQSFDFPTDTLLPGMKHGKNLVTGNDRHLTSWKSADDPASGEFSDWIDTKGYPQLIIREGGEIMFRGGPWNALWFSGTPNLKPNRFFNFTFVLNHREIYFQYNQIDTSILMRIILQTNGHLEGLFWSTSKQEWILYTSPQLDRCDRYSVCGPFGICDINNPLFCLCLNGFEPASPDRWRNTDWSQGCRYTVPLDCNPSEGFKKFSNLKLPDTQWSWYNQTMTLVECEKMCKSNCSCSAYTNSNMSGTGSGCLLWFGDLIDIRTVGEDGDTLYIRLSASELDKTQSELLDWSARYSIINGIARGLLYLHQDSRLRIIHRDLKVSNILLDMDMNPKISDFGMARIFRGNQIEANTDRVVGTYGYMAPEYAGDGIFSIKSDVYSFGVLVLEIVCGEKNRDFLHKEEYNNLTGHAWELHNEGISLQLVDKCLVESINIPQVHRSIHIGLLCVQRHPEDRPTMTSIIMMLGSEGPLLAPKEPGFYIGNTKQDTIESSSSHRTNSNNEVTITMLNGR
ncbi:hypothetical protein SSX86_030555 [Deinandra increscens subsp. villosa]|uniref:non-specific serine/threonine protein kinase n=1 Tax=Deinandra increscens subsp. villosa TaxID=3103831 RepID=A0AAP0GIH9_9ASTR